MLLENLQKMFKKFIFFTPKIKVELKKYIRFGILNLKCIFAYT